jgi:hypothetical protein
VPNTTYRDLAPDPARFEIIYRLELGLKRMAAHQDSVRAIYLTKADQKALNAALSKHWSEISGGGRSRVVACSYKGHAIRQGARSIIYSVHGVALKLPQPRQTKRTR